MAGDQTMSDPAKLLLVQFLAWLESRPRTYGDVQEAWRSSCPRLSTWEDALDGGLIRFANEGGLRSHEASVVLTPSGRTMLRMSEL